MTDLPDNPTPDGQPENTERAHVTKASEAPKKIRTQWAKGQSGNPGGRPRGEREVRELAQKHGARAIKRLVELMASPNERVAVAATVAILDRGFGKPAQALTGPDNTPLFPPGSATQVIATAQQGAEFLAAFMANPGMDISGVTFAEPEPSLVITPEPRALTLSTDPAYMVSTMRTDAMPSPLPSPDIEEAPAVNNALRVWEVLGK